MRPKASVQKGARAHQSACCTSVAKIACRPIRGAPRDRPLPISTGQKVTQHLGPRAAASAADSSLRNSADELNKRTRGAGTVARRFLEVPAT